MTDQKDKICHPELGYSGDLNLSGKVHTLNVGDLHSGQETGLAATDVECKSRNSHSSRSEATPRAGRRAVASREVPKEVGTIYIARKQRDLSQIRDYATSGEPCDVKVSSTVRRREGEKHAHSGGALPSYPTILATSIAYDGDLAVALGILVFFIFIGIIFLVMASDCTREYQDKLKELKRRDRG